MLKERISSQAIDESNDYMFAGTSSKIFSLSQEAPEVTMTLSQELHSRCLNCSFDHPSSTTVTGLVMFS